MARPIWNSRLLGASALLGAGAMAWILAIGPASSPAAEPSALAAAPGAAAAQPVSLAQAGPAAGVKPGEAGMRPGENENHGRGPGFKGPNPNEVPKQLTPEQVEDFLSILHEQNPVLEARIRKALIDNPRGANETIAPHWPRVRPLIELKHSNPALFDLTLQDIRLTRQFEEQIRRYRNTRDPAAAEQIRSDMRQLLSNRFDIRQKMLEARLSQMKEELDQRVQNRDKLIDDELKQHLAQATTRPDGPRKRDSDGPRLEAANPKK